MKLAQDNDGPASFGLIDNPVIEIEGFWNIFLSVKS